MSNQSDKISPSASQKIVDAIAYASPNTPVILDFDETLLLRNSTAEYINSLRPRPIGFILIVLLKIIRPWAWFPRPFRGDRVRDWFLVVVPSILLPWTLLFWQQKAKKLARNHTNEELISTMSTNSNVRTIVASLGFDFIIDPLLQQIPLQCDRLVSCRFWHPGDRSKGKLMMMQELLSRAEIETAILVTDSEDDLPLLEVVGQPYFVLWSQAKYVEPFHDFWLYSWLQKIKGK